MNEVFPDMLLEEGLTVSASCESQECDEIGKAVQEIGRRKASGAESLSDSLRTLTIACSIQLFTTIACHSSMAYNKVNGTLSWVE